jgi:hypothetical protein
VPVDAVWQRSLDRIRNQVGDIASATESRPAPVTGGLPLINTTEKIGPGINLQHVQALDQNGWYCTG